MAKSMDGAAIRDLPETTALDRRRFGRPLRTQQADPSTGHRRPAAGRSLHRLPASSAVMRCGQFRIGDQQYHRDMQEGEQSGCDLFVG